MLEHDEWSHQYSDEVVMVASESDDEQSKRLEDVVVHWSDVQGMTLRWMWMDEGVSGSKVAHEHGHNQLWQPQCWNEVELRGDWQSKLQGGVMAHWNGVYGMALRW